MSGCSDDSLWILHLKLDFEQLNGAVEERHNRSRKTASNAHLGQRQHFLFVTALKHTSEITIRHEDNSITVER